MKKLLTLIILASFNCKAQEDCRTKVTSTINTVTIKNKNCPTRYLIERQNMLDSITCLVKKDSSITLHLSFCGELRILPTVKCNCSCDYAAITLNRECNALPVRFSKIWIEQDNKELIVHFTINEITNIRRFILNVSTDFKTFKPLSIILPENVKVGIPYSQKFKL